MFQRLVFAGCLLLMIAHLEAAVLHRCDFEGDFCGWQNNGTDGANWTYATGSTPTFDTGPPAGHGGAGHYIYMEANDFNAGEGATRPGGVRLISVPFSLNGDGCFRLYFYKWNTQDGKLYAGVLAADGRDISGFNQTNDSEKNWTCGFFAVHPPSQKFQIYVEARVGRSSVFGDIAVDDFALFDSDCGSLTKTKICDPSAGETTLSPSTQEGSSTSSTPSVGSIASSPSSTSSSSSSSSSHANPTPSPTLSQDSTPSPSFTVDPLIFLSIPAVVIVLGVPVAIFLYCRGRRHKPVIFSPYEASSDRDNEVYDEIGHVNPYDSGGDYDDIVGVVTENEAQQPLPPPPCPRPGQDLFSRDHDLPNKPAPPLPSIRVTSPDENSRNVGSDQPGRELSYLDMADQSRGKGRPVSQHSYLDMADQSEGKGRPVSQHSYLDMADQSEGKARPISQGSYLDMADQSEGKGSPVSQHSYLDMAGSRDEQRAGRRSSGSPYLDMENLADEDDYVNEERPSQGDYLNLRRPDLGEESDDNSYLKPVFSDHAHSDTDSHHEPKI